MRKLAFIVLISILMVMSLNLMVFAETYTVGMSAAFPPFEFVEDDEIVGIDPDIMKAIGELQGFEVEFKDFGSFDSVLPALGSGHVDIVASGVTIKEERKKKYDFSVPYYGADQSVIIKKDSDKDITVLFGDNSIGVQMGTTGDIWVTEHLKDTGILNGKVARYDKYTMVIADLVNGNIDAVVLDNAVADEYAKIRPVKVVGIIKTYEQYAIAVQKGNKELLEKINAGLEELRQSGKLQEIIQKYEEN